VDQRETGRKLCELVRSENGRLSQDVEAIAGLAAGVLRLDGENAGIFQGLQGSGLASADPRSVRGAPGEIRMRAQSS